jgi:predicted metalloprotease with PDZ domain
VYANEFDLRTRGLNDEHGFVDGTAVFMYCPKYRSLSVTLTVVPFSDWHVTTGLDSVTGKRFQFSAPNYDYLVDCPIEIGNQKDYLLEVEGKPHVISFAGPISCNMDSLKRDIFRIVTMNSKFWGGLPYARYVFLIHATTRNGGGTEHINSAALATKATFSRRAEHCTDLVGLISHEFLHTWNVKRLRPKGMDPYDWTAENYYRELWIAEGGTSYLHNLLLMRSGFSSARKYLDGIAYAVQSDRRRPGNTVQSLSECSFDAWVKFSRGTQQAYNAETNLYEKGAHVCLLLDLEIRHRSNNKFSFDDLMRTLYKKFPLGSSGYTVDDVQKVGEELTGNSLQEFFDSYVHGTKPLDWEHTLGYAGIILMPLDTLPKPWLGIVTADEGGKTVVKQVIAGSPGYDAGLNVDDEVLALDGYRVNTNDLERRVERLQAGDKVTFTLFREATLREFTIVLKNRKTTLYVISKVQAPSPLQKAIYESWLNDSWDAAGN